MAQEKFTLDDAVRGLLDGHSASKSIVGSNLQHIDLDKYRTHLSTIQRGVTSGGNEVSNPMINEDERAFIQALQNHNEVDEALAGQVDAGYYTKAKAVTIDQLSEDARTEFYLRILQGNKYLTGGKDPLKFQDSIIKKASEKLGKLKKSLDLVTRLASAIHSTDDSQLMDAVTAVAGEFNGADVRLIGMGYDLRHGNGYGTRRVLAKLAEKKQREVLEALKDGEVVAEIDKAIVDSGAYRDVLSTGYQMHKEDLGRYSSLAKGEQIDYNKASKGLQYVVDKVKSIETATDDAVKKQIIKDIEEGLTRDVKSEINGFYQKKP